MSVVYSGSNFEINVSAVLFNACLLKAIFSPANINCSKNDKIIHASVNMINKVRGLELLRSTDKSYICQDKKPISKIIIK